MKKVLTIGGAVLLYIYGISAILSYFPFPDTPSYIVALFTKESQSNLAWMIVQQKVAVILVAFLVACFLQRLSREKALYNAIFVGVLSVIWGIAYRGVVFYLNGLSPFKSSGVLGWINITDYLAVLIALPLFVAVMARYLRQKTRASNKPLQPTACSGG